MRCVIAVEGLGWNLKGEGESYWTRAAEERQECMGVLAWWPIMRQGSVRRLGCLRVGDNLSATRQSLASITGATMVR